MADTVSDLARRLAGHAEAVCRHYLSNGRRSGGYWMVGDVHNAPGQSLYVRLHGPTGGKGAAGRWRDAATGEFGDLLDMITAVRTLNGLSDAMEEARHFLGEAQSPPAPPSPAPARTSAAAARLFRVAKPIVGTLAERYLLARGIALSDDMAALRFHPHCWHKPAPGAPSTTPDGGPALIAAVSNLDGAITGVQRTWLDPSGLRKAPIATPRRALGYLLGNAVRFGTACEIMAAGEGIETTLSLRRALPGLPLAAALSAAHLSAIHLPATSRRLYIVRDNDAAGRNAAEILTARATAMGIETFLLTPVLGDFNDDLTKRGAGAFAASIRAQLAPEDVARFWRLPKHG